MFRQSRLQAGSVGAGAPGEEGMDGVFPSILFKESKGHIHGVTLRRSCTNWVDAAEIAKSCRRAKKRRRR
eukprot:358669-Chlamydomonas_euryale.AAC.7